MRRRIAIGDVHGCSKTLQTLIEGGINPDKKDELYFVGDLIDRGPSTREVLDYLLELKSKGFNIHVVRGNHEDIFLKAHEDESFVNAWFSNGAEETLNSFDAPEIIPRNQECLKIIPEKYLKFIMEMPLYYNLSDCIIVHAGLNFESDDILKDEHAMLWSRHMNYLPGKVNSKTIIHGHTPIPVSTIKNIVNDPKCKILNIDAGCVYKYRDDLGVLVALDIDKREMITQENID